MNEDNNFVCAVLSVEGAVHYYASDETNEGVPDTIIRMLNDLSWHHDSEDDYHVVSVLCDEAWKVHDIRIDDESIGYFATKSFCMEYGLEQAKLLYQGEYCFETLREIADHRPVSIQDLFGSLWRV
jgi:hypothetical protein